MVECWWVMVMSRLLFVARSSRHVTVADTSILVSAAHTLF